MKNTLRLKALISIVIISMILAIANIANAYSASGKLSSTDKLVAGGNVQVTLALSDIDMDVGIYSITIGNISYDTNVFDPISTSSFVGSNGWSASYASGKVTLVNLSPMSESGNVVTLTLKIKEGITATSSTVKFENIVVASGTTTTGNVSIGTPKVTIKSDAVAESGSEAGTPANTPAPETNTPANTPKKITSSKSKTKIPAAGDSATIVITAAIAVIAIVGIVGFVKYAKNKDIK